MAERVLRWPDGMDFTEALAHAYHRQVCMQGEHVCQDDCNVPDQTDFDAAADIRQILALLPE